MMYESAHKSFAAAASVQPACGIAYWGQAMTFVHPLWSDPPPAATFDKGALLADTAMAEGKKTDRERAYVEAVQAYYKAGKSPKEAPNLRAFATRLDGGPCEVSGRSRCCAVLRARAVGNGRSVGQDVRSATPRR